MSQDYEQANDSTSDDAALPAEEHADFSQGGEETAYYGEAAKTPVSKGTIAMFLILAAAGVGTYFMYVRSGTQAASAAVDVKAQQAISQFMTDRDRNLAQMQKMLRDTDAVVKQFLNYPSVTQIPLSDLKTNPFRVTATTAQTQTISRKDEEKEKKRREEERVAVLKAVQGLQLQSVMISGSNRACMINNTLYTEGQEVDAFTIEKVAANSIIVRNGSYRFELRMQR